MTIGLHCDILGMLVNEYMSVLAYVQNVLHNGSVESTSIH